MIHGVSSHLIRNHRLTVEWLQRVQGAGVDVVELFLARQSMDYRDRAQVGEVARWFRDHELRLHSIHLPMRSDDLHINIAEPDRAARRRSADELKRALEMVEEAPCRFAIQHVGLGQDGYDERKFDAAYQALDELNGFAHDRGVEILLENIPNELSSGERLRKFVESTRLPNGFCFDTGHANVMEGVDAAFDAMADRVRSTHVHDNDGVHDIHLFPYLAPRITIDWGKAMRLLKSRADQYPLLLELREPADIADPLGAVQRIFEKLEEER
jgi:sugar phosphate isomerase/epimerase